MSYRGFIGAAALTLVLAPAWHGAAHAQFGAFSNLPEDDFTWRWGRQRGSDDFSIRGIDLGFTCTLTGALRPGSRLSRMEIRQIETSLRSSMAFIESATSMMNGLDRQRDLDWAVLDCEKQGDDD